MRLLQRDEVTFFPIPMSLPVFSPSRPPPLDLFWRSSVSRMQVSRSARIHGGSNWWDASRRSILSGEEAHHPAPSPPRQMKWRGMHERFDITISLHQLAIIRGSRFFKKTTHRALAITCAPFSQTHLTSPHLNIVHLLPRPPSTVSIHHPSINHNAIIEIPAPPTTSSDSARSLPQIQRSLIRSSAIKYSPALIDTTPFLPHPPSTYPFIATISAILQPLTYSR